VAQAFSTRVAGLKRNCGSACSTNEAVKSCGEKPALKCPSTISSTSPAEMPASASASFATLTTRLSTVSVSNFPNGVCAHPTMLAVMVVLPGSAVIASVAKQSIEPQARTGLLRRKSSSQ